MKEALGYIDYTEIFLDERERESELQRIERAEREVLHIREQGALAHIPHRIQRRV